MEILQRFSELFSNPADAFKGLDTKPLDTKNMLIGMSIYLVVIISFSWLMTSDENLKLETVKERSAAIEKARLSGQISAEDAAIQIKTVEAQIMQSGEVTGTVSYTVVGIFVYFIVAFYFYLAANFLGTVGKFSYQSALSINTIFALFNAVQIVITDCLFIIQGNFHSTLGISLFIGNYNGNNLLHVMLANIDFFTVTYLYLAAIALKEAAGIKTFYAVLVMVLPFLMKLGFTAANILMN